MTYDLVIIGGGPAGVAAGVYAARKKLKAALITDRFGGQSITSTDIQNWIGTPSISGLELGERLEQHLRAQDDVIEIVEGDTVVSVTSQNNLFTITAKSGTTLTTRTILLATGSRRRRLGVPGEEKFEGKGVVYCSTCDAPLFSGKDVAVVGGGNAGMEAVMDLIPYARRIYLLEQLGALQGDAVTEEKVRACPSVQIILNASVEEIVGEELVDPTHNQVMCGVKEIRFRNSANADATLPVAGVFVEIGIVPNSDIVKGLVTVNERGEVVVNPRTQATSRTGVWAAGDVTDCPYRQNNISTGDAVKAILNLYEHLAASRGT